MTTTRTELPTEPQVFHLLQGEALGVWHSPTGDVGWVFRGAGIEVVWVSKQDEAIDPEWFSQRSVDLIVVIRGQLCVEFAEGGQDRVMLDPGDLLVLPPNTRCHGYRWPRERREATVFLAVYPVPDAAEKADDGAAELESDRVGRGTEKREASTPTTRNPQSHCAQTDGAGLRADS